MMSPEKRHAVDVAHGAAMRLLNNGRADMAEFLQLEAAQVPLERRGQFLITALDAAVIEHVGTLVAMQERGLIESAAEVMSMSAQLRDAALDAGPEDEQPWND